MRAGLRLPLAIAGAAALTWASAAPVHAQGFGPGSQAPYEASTTRGRASEGAVRAVLRDLLGGQTGDVAAFYHERDYKPIWVRGGVRREARAFVEALADARDPAAEGLERALDRAVSGGAEELAKAELELSEVLAGQGLAVDKSKTGAGLEYVDPELARQWGGGRQALEAAAKSSSLTRYIRQRIEPRNPLHVQLSQALEEYRASFGSLPDVKITKGPALATGAKGARVKALRKRLGLPEGSGLYDEALAAAVRAFQASHGLTVTGRADANTIAALNRGPWHYEQVILANLERARALPPSFGERYILVDAAAGELKFYEDGEVRKTMKVVVGKPEMATPMMAGLMRHAVFNPYWNVPEDLVQTSIAPKVLKQGLAYLQDQNMQVLSDYTSSAVELDPASVDWKGVAEGRVSVRVRQLPGPKNMMGQVKLAFPNPLGIFLHDTPMRDLFGLEQRTASSGCVRLEDALALAELLVGERTAERLLSSGQTEVQAPLKAPVPVYITYLTVAATEQGLAFRPDVYGRDKLWLAQQAKKSLPPEKTLTSGSLPPIGGGNSIS
jgi:murein L,D-transpeptidase YcbB/YkuD